MMQGYREVGDDGDYCSTFQCLSCKEYFAIRSNMDKWKHCPICGNAWQIINCRREHTPKWMWNMFKSNEVPYEYWGKFQPKQVFQKPIIEIEWRIIGHERWSRSTSYVGDNRQVAFAAWQRETKSEAYWDTEYRMIWNGKTILNKVVKKTRQD
jgi:predicted RNA-binding Zn-ribbon protein involved in translation (DUF1610 family)